MSELFGASPWENKLYEYFTSHVKNEIDLLVEYRDAANNSPSPAFRYLSSLILEDEMRHHRVFEELAQTLKNEAEFHPEAPAIPHLDKWGPDPEAVLSLNKRLLENEKADAMELHQLFLLLKGQKFASMWLLLVKIMEMDTQKHIAILEFVKENSAEKLK
jgi:rubrerythrin